MLPPLPPNPPEAAAHFNDSGWGVVDVPHDFLIGGNYSEYGDAEEGARLPRGDGWYRKHFALPDEDRGKVTWLYVAQHGAAQ